MTEKTISEYGYIYHDKPQNLNEKFIHKEITEAEFNELLEYWKQNDDIQKVLEYSGKRYFKATSYVGIIQTQNLSIEILPKIYDNKNNEEAVRKIFIQMLKPLLDINEVQINKANLSITHNKNIYEMFK